MPGSIPKFPLRCLVGILKLSTKYQIDHLRFHSLRLFHTITGHITLAEFDEKSARSGEISARVCYPLHDNAMPCSFFLPFTT
ncbi:hypothetical protein BDV98DRAFT_378679 [Pterulicium gracile]|uniref:Uncharacterized protein n=1 Tax=Pterulicium gracile TaxID=1884261 RepID=A0A5C3QAL7_9AGAR|nr:hypothetical protein BDV98DRAFT_378679 [Pterula gracilis]